MSKLSKNGIIAGFSSGIAWGLDTTLMGVILVTGIFNRNENVIFVAPIITAFLHDLFSSIWIGMLHIKKGNLRGIFKKIRTKNGLVVSGAALLGGPIGMSGYLLAIKYIGPAYTASISDFYPAVGAFLAFIILKDKLSMKGIFGLVISIGAIIILGYTSDGISNNSLIGYGFALIAVIGWGMESVVCSYGMDGNNINPDEALFIRQLTSALVYGIVIVPVMGGVNIIREGIPLNIICLIGITSLVGTVSYLLYYTSISRIGATRAMALNITYSVWAIVFQLVFFKALLSIKIFICSIIIIIGSVLTASDQDYQSI